ncbi:MAG: 16S rRNA (adenine(1518)-N(6)/adenine(1519)-N(6))-dimethyltransferase RsmA [Planctomycetota bacterium]
MQTLSEIRSLLAERGLHPRHRFGQNFLHDHQQIARLLDAADVQPEMVVLEVGPGTGILTEALLQRGATVIACEIDRDLASLIRDRLGDRITLIEGDCLDRGRTLNPQIYEVIDGRTFRLVANLPYQAASPLMSTLAVDTPNCDGQFVTIQREVADRLLASHGSKTYGPLGIIVQSVCEVQRISVVPATCFWPAPKVTSAMVSLLPREDRLVEDASAFARFIVMVFSKRRKQLGSIVGRDHEWPDDITPDRRPEQLSVSQLASVWAMARDAAWLPPS